jgi:glycosyltransferase involved in cell wall biosynthesis
MRIIYLSGSVFPSRFAHSIQVMRMCEAFAGNGHEVTLVGKQSEAGWTRDIHEFYGVLRSFELVLMPCRRLKGASILILPKLRRWLRQYDPKETLIYARDIYGVSLAVRMGFRAIYETHAVPYNRLIQYIERSLLRSDRLIRLVVISQALRNLYMAGHGVGNKILVCHDAAAVPKESAGEDLPWPPCRDTLQIGYVGNLYRGRGVEIIMECAKRLSQYDFHIVGGGEEDVAFWKARAGSNTYFHGFVEPSWVHAVHRRCDVLLMPYQRAIENPHSHLNTVPWMSPLKLFEYMASRRAMIASDLPVLREVLDETMAVLVSPDSLDEWVDAIRRCEDRPFRELLAGNAFDAMIEHYTWQKRATKILEHVVL